MNFVSFFEQFLRNPVQTGAVIASSPKLCQVMVREAGVKQASVVVEFGTGTGSVTREILRQKRPGTNLIGFEINEKFAEVARQGCPRAEIINACATTASDVLQKKNLNHCDSVVSGLPWAAFSMELQNRLLLSAVQALRPGGTFVTFAYVHSLPLSSAQRFKRQLHTVFAHVEQSEIVWGNIPPAIVYVAQKQA